MKDYLKQKWPEIIALGLISGLLLFVQPQITFSKKSLAPVKPVTSVAANIPLRLEIPVLKINTKIESVGMTPQGAMGIPKNINDVAWFNLGPRPGDQGSAVIAGHLDWYGGLTAVFGNLSKLKPGDKMSVKNSAGQSITFAVRESRTYATDADATPIFTSAGGAHLNLITCAGVWDKSQHRYTKRLVVFTDLLP